MFMTIKYIGLIPLDTKWYIIIIKIKRYERDVISVNEGFLIIESENLW